MPLIEQAAPPRTTSETLDFATGKVQQVVKTVAAEPKTDAATAPAPGTPQPGKVEDPKVSSRFAALSRKERSIVQRQQDLASKEALLAAREAKVAEFETQWASDPTKAAESRGLTYTDWTTRVLNDGKVTPEQQVLSVKAELDKFRQEQADKEAARIVEEKNALQAQNDAVIQEFRNEVANHIKTNSETYELINLHNANDLVLATIEQYFSQHQKILGNTEACDLVEQYLEEQVIKSTETKKFKAKAIPQPVKEDPKPAEKTTPKQPTTLTNNMTSSAPSFLPAHTENERIKRALAALDRPKT